MESRPPVRAIRAEDRADWARLWTGYLGFYNTRLPQTAYDSLFARLLTPGDDGPFGLLAELDGRPAGLVHFLYHGHCWRPEGAVYLQDLFTDPAARGQGVARALIEAVYARADAAGRPYVYWLTQTGNSTARGLYDRIGVATDFIRYVRA